MTETRLTLLLSTAYAPPVSYFVKLYEYATSGRIALEGCEHYIAAASSAPMEYSP